MGTFKIEPVLLPEAQKEELLRYLNHPDIAYIRALKEQNGRINSAIGLRRQGKDLIWSIPQLDLSFI